MSQYCYHCHKFAEPRAGRCPGCGNQMNRQHPANYFVSGLNPQPHPKLTLNPGAFLQKERFCIKRHLGDGSVGSVYLACDNLRGQEVALKIVALGPYASDIPAQLLQQENSIYSKITDFSHIIKVHDIHLEPWGGTSLLFISMEYADGGSFRKWLIENHNDLQRRRREGLPLFQQICCGTRVLHQTGIVHLDLKPENLLFVNGVLKVSDLGTSRFIHDVQMSCGIGPDEHITPRGTAAYTAPEIYTAAHQDDIDNRADIYSLGVILFEILHCRCRPPFGGTYQQLREHHIHTPAPRLADAQPHEARVLARCLEKDPQGRYETVRQMLDALEEREEPVYEYVAPSDDNDQEEKLAQQANHLWERACQCIPEKNFAEATRLGNQVLRLKPDHDDAQSMIEQIQQRYDKTGELYRMIEREMASLSLEQQAGMLEEAMALYPNHPEGLVVQTRIDVAAREFRRCMEDGRAALKKQALETAQASFERARQMNPGSPAVAQALEFVHNIQNEIATARQHIDEAIGRQNHGEARSLARRLDEYIERIIEMLKDL